MRGWGGLQVPVRCRLFTVSPEMQAVPAGGGGQELSGGDREGLAPFLQTKGPQIQGPPGAGRADCGGKRLGVGRNWGGPRRSCPWRGPMPVLGVSRSQCGLGMSHLRRDQETPGVCTS